MQVEDFDVDFDDDDLVVTELSPADFGQVQRIMCMICRTASMLQMTENKIVQHCPYCGSKIEPLMGVDLS